MSAEEQYRLNLQMSDFLSCWSAPAYSQREAGGNEMLAFALNYAQAFCPSEIRSAGDMSVISCDALNRILLQHFGRRISFIDGKNYDPYQAGSSEWACQCRNGELYFPPAGGVYTSFAIAGPLRQMSDGSLEFSFTEYQPLSQDSSSTQSS